MATEYLNNNSNLKFNNKISVETEFTAPQFDSISDLNAYTPERSGAIANVGENMYHYNGTEWVLDAGGTGSSSAFRADTLSDL